jgi:Cbb3-type cytochrome oxidase component FixQ.
MIAIFVGICIWAFSPQRRSENDKAAHLVFEDEDIDTRTREQQRGSKDDE